MSMDHFARFTASAFVLALPRILPSSEIGKCVAVAKRKGRDWFVAVDGLRFDPGTTSEKFLAASGATGLFRDCTFERVANYVGNAERCVFKDCGFRPPPAYGYHGSWIKCRAEGGRMCGNICRNVYVDCDFKDVRFGANSGEQHLLDCRLENAGFSTFFVPGKMTGSVERCTLVGKCVFPKCMTTTHMGPYGDSRKNAKMGSKESN